MLDISNFSNLGLPTIGEKVVYATKPADLSRLYSTYRSILILGKGTNTVFINHKINTLLLYLDDHIQHVTDTIISVGSSLELDVFVDYCMRANLSGLECLSGIPGTIGGAVVLNSGAFGSTIADRLVSVTVYDSYTHSQIELPRNKLQMTHRNSIFRASSRYVILSAIFKLSHGIDETTHPRVMAVEQEKRNTPKLLRNTILSLRSSMPDFHTTRYVGSFFLNPIVNHMTYKNILSLYPDIVARKNGQHTYELSAGSILDALGLKGTSINHFYFHHNNANYLINTGKAKNTDLLEVIEYVSSLTMRTLNLELRPEPQLF